MNRDEYYQRSKKTPIEQIFRQIVGRKMTPNERQVLLAKGRKRKKARGDNDNFQLPISRIIGDWLFETYEVS